MRGANRLRDFSKTRWRRCGNRSPTAARRCKLCKMCRSRQRVGVPAQPFKYIQPRAWAFCQAKFEALKRKLDAEGLFDAARNANLPKFPKRIGIVTSPSGAADSRHAHVLRRRAHGLQILINPVRVQGTARPRKSRSRFASWRTQRKFRAGRSDRPHPRRRKHGRFVGVQ